MAGLARGLMSEGLFGGSDAGWLIGCWPVWNGAMHFSFPGRFAQARAYGVAAGPREQAKPVRPLRPGLGLAQPPSLHSSLTCLASGPAPNQRMMN